MEFFYRIVESGFVFVVVFDDAEFSIGWIVMSGSEYFLFFKKSISILFESKTYTRMFSIITLDDIVSRIKFIDKIVELYKGILSDSIIR